MVIAIRYIGKRETYTDGTYGSRVTFKKGESLLVPDDIAVKMLKHPDVYVRGDLLSADVGVVIPPNPQLNEDTQDLRDSIMRLDSQTIIDKVFAEYQVKLDKRQGAPKLREKYIALIDQYGPV